MSSRWERRAGGGSFCAGVDVAKAHRAATMSLRGIPVHQERPNYFPETVADDITTMQHGGTSVVDSRHHAATAFESNGSEMEPK